MELFAISFFGNFPSSTSENLEKGVLPRLAKACKYGPSAHVYPSLATPIIRMPTITEPVLPPPFLTSRKTYPSNGCSVIQQPDSKNLNRTSASQKVVPAPNSQSLVNSKQD